MRIKPTSSLLTPADRGQSGNLRDCDFLKSTLAFFLIGVAFFSVFHWINSHFAAFDTCHRQTRNSFEYLTAALNAHFAGQPIPLITVRGVNGYHPGRANKQRLAVRAAFESTEEAKSRP